MQICMKIYGLVIILDICYKKLRNHSNISSSIYRNVGDIDLVTGLLSEAPLPDSVLGPTFLCLLGRTFRNIRFGK